MYRLSRGSPPRNLPNAGPTSRGLQSGPAIIRNSDTAQLSLRFGRNGDAEAYKLAAALRDEPRGRGLDVALQTREELILGKAGRDGIEDLHHDRAGPPGERTPRPEQAGVERDRHARHADLGIKVDHPILVTR